MMTNAKVRLLEYLNNIQEVLIDLNILLSFVEFPIPKNNEEIFQKIWRRHSIFFEFAMTSFKQSFVIDLHQLLKKDNKRSLFWYLEQAKTNCKEYFETELIEKQINELCKFDSTIKNLAGLRDKFYAHREPKYFDNRNQNFDFGLSTEEIRDLLNLMEVIVQVHRYKLDETLISCRISSDEYLKKLLGELIYLEKFDVLIKSEWADCIKNRDDEKRAFLELLEKKLDILNN